MICPCGGLTRDHETLAGRVYTCNACGRRELFAWKAAENSDEMKKRIQAEIMAKTIIDRSHR